MKGGCRQGALRSLQMLGALAVACALLTACDSSNASSEQPSAGGPTSPTASPSPGGTTPGPGNEPDDPATTGVAEPGRDPVLEHYTPAIRNGKAPHPTVTAAPAPFDGTVAWSDGLTLEITGVEQGVVEGQGPGVLVGQPSTSLELRMTNSSSRTVSLNGVVVTMVYGPDHRVARPVYDDKAARDFTGKLRPQKSTSAVYLFSVPKAQLDRLTMYVDFDGVHTVAVFSGPLN